MSGLRSSALVLCALTALSSCTLVQASDGAGDLAPAMRWDHVPSSIAWEAASFAALDSHAAVLPTLVPEDIETWCPGYPTASEADREAFWVGLISALAQHESTWNPELVGGDGRWFGLVQISPATARFYGCEATSGQALLDGVSNVSCAYRIWAHTVERDNMISHGNRGVAADWGPMHSSQSRKRDDMRAWITSQSYCQP